MNISGQTCTRYDINGDRGIPGICLRVPGFTGLYLRAVFGAPATIRPGCPFCFQGGLWREVHVVAAAKSGFLFSLVAFIYLLRSVAAFLLVYVRYAGGRLVFAEGHVPVRSIRRPEPAVRSHPSNATQVSVITKPSQHAETRNGEVGGANER